MADLTETISALALVTVVIGAHVVWWMSLDTTWVDHIERIRRRALQSTQRSCDGSRDRGLENGGSSPSPRPPSLGLRRSGETAPAPGDCVPHNDTETSTWNASTGT